jgi:cyclohexadienyl dehydratase
LRQVEAPALSFQEVLSGRADVTITSNVDAANLVRRYPELAIVPVDRARGRRPASFLMPQNDQVWLNYVNNWITVKRMLGFFDELDKKWLQPTD